MSYFEGCMYFSANKLARYLNRIADEAFKDLEITPTQGFALIAVGELDRHTPSEIAAELEMKPSTITRFLDKLEKCGFIERTYQGRMARVEITQSGIEELKKIQACWKRIDDMIVATCGREMSKEVTNGIIKANQLYKNI